MWIARIMLTWGLIAGAQAFVAGEFSLNIVRLLLGVAEAGFFPGMIFFLTLWFPAAYRARIVGWFMFAIPISTVIGAPISGLILNLEGVAGPARLAMDVPDRGAAGDPDDARRALLSDRPPEGGALAGAGGKPVAAGPARRRARQSRTAWRHVLVPLDAAIRA